MIPTFSDINTSVPWFWVKQNSIQTSVSLSYTHFCMQSVYLSPSVLLYLESSYTDWLQLLRAFTEQLVLKKNPSPYISYLAIPKYTIFHLKAYS